MIKKSSIFIIGLLCIGACHYQNSSDLFVDSKTNCVTEPVQKLLELTQVDCTSLNLSDVVRHTQNEWLRKSGVERWQMPADAYKQGNEIMIQFEKLGMFQAIKPSEKTYDYLVIPGSLFRGMILRCSYAVECFHMGCRFKQVVLLGSDRPLVPDQGENAQSFLNYVGQFYAASIDLSTIKTEIDALKLAYEYIPNKPHQVCLLPVTCISAPMIEQADGRLIRPSTKDTVNEWMKTHPKAGSILLVSNQPYVQYQHEVFCTLLPSEFSVETVGIVNSAQIETIGVLLDTVARILYQKLERYKLSKN